MNYFELFGIPVQLKPAKDGLKSKYYELSRKYHPDYHSQASEELKTEALELSSHLNRAWKTLGNEEETIKYVLQLKGLMEEEEKYGLPPDFLMEMMEINEQAVEARLMDDKNRLDSIREEIAETQKKIYEPVKEIVEQYQDSTISKKELLQVKDYYYKKKYLKRILEGLP